MENFSELQSTCIKVFEEVAKGTSIFVLPLFLGKIAFSNLSGDGDKALQAFKGVLIYFCLLAGFPLILEILFSIPETYLPKMSSLTNFENSPELTDSSIIPFALDRIMEVILAGLYWIAYYLHIFFMLIMCSMAPVVFLSSTLLGMGLGIEIFMGLLIIGSSWPIIWFGFDQVHIMLAAQQIDSFSLKCLELLLTLFKGLAPVAFAAVAVKSPAGQAVSKSTKAAASFATRTAGVTVGPVSSGISFAREKLFPAPLSRETIFFNKQRKLSANFWSGSDSLSKSRARMKNQEGAKQS